MSPQQLAKLKLQTTLAANAIGGFIPLFTQNDPVLGLVLAKQIQAIPTERWSEVERDYNALKGNAVGAAPDDSGAVDASLVNALEDCIKGLKG